MILGIVLRRELQDRFARLLGEPHDGALGHRRRPLDVLEHPGRRDARQLAGRREIEIDGAVGVPLQERGGDVGLDLTLDGALHDRRLVLARRDQRDLARLEDRRDPHRDRLARHVVFAEEVGGRILAGDRVEGDEPRTRIGRRSGLVEADVAALADAEQLEVDAAHIGDGALEGGGMLGQALARHAAVRDVDVRRDDVHVGEQILPHVAPVAVRAVCAHRVVFVEVEGDHPREVEAAGLVAANQLAVHADRRAPRREPQHGAPLRRRFAVDHVDDAIGQQPHEIVVIRHDDGADALPVAGALDRREGVGRGCRQTFTSIVAPRLYRT